MEKTLQALRLIPVWFIRQYQKWLSPLIGPSCRFHPTCSQYAIEAIQRRGFFVGSYLAVKRIGKCHPFHPGGVDHVPEKPSKKHE